MGLFDIVGGRPEQKPERATDVGLKMAALREANSPSAKLQGAMDAYQKGIQTRQNNQINETKARQAKILGILQEGLTLPDGDPRKEAARQLATTISSNPAFLGSLGMKVSASATMSPLDKRGEKARWEEFKGAAKTNDSLSSAENVLNQLDTAFNNALPDLSKDGTEAIGTGLGKTISGRLGMNEKLRAYNDQAKALSSNLSRGLFAEKGVLTDKDREVAMRSLPNEFDSQITYNTKINILRSIIQKAKDNYQKKRLAYMSGVDFVPEDSGVGSSSLPNQSSSRASTTTVGKYTLVQ